MSDTSNSNAQLDAGTAPAISGTELQKSISGHAQDQDTLSFARGPEADAARIPAVKPVDSKTITGSYPGDHRATAAPAVIPPNPAPRDGMRQAPLGEKSPSNLPGTVANWTGDADTKN